MQIKPWKMNYETREKILDGWAVGFTLGLYSLPTTQSSVSTKRERVSIARRAS
jgi:hypothetical protein